MGLFSFELICRNPQVIRPRLTELQINSLHHMISQLTLERENVQSTALGQKQERKHCVIFLFICPWEGYRDFIC